MTQISKKLLYLANHFYVNCTEKPIVTDTFMNLIENKLGEFDEDCIADRNTRELYHLAIQLCEESRNYLSKLTQLYSQLDNSLKSEREEFPIVLPEPIHEIKPADKENRLKSAASKLIFSRKLKEKESMRPCIGIKMRNEYELTTNLIIRAGDTFIEVIEADPSLIKLRINETLCISTIELPSGVYKYGRDRKCVITSRDPKVSAVHAEILFQGGKWVYQDKSRNGSWIMLHNIETINRSTESSSFTISDESEMCDIDFYFVFRELKCFLRDEL